MIPKGSQTSSVNADNKLKLVGISDATSPVAPPACPTLRAELRKAFEASWKRNEAAYRYLGR